MISRRNVLLHGSFIGAGYVASRMAGFEAVAQQVPLRRSVSELPANDPHIQALRDGVRILKAKPTGDKLNWIALATIHGTEAGFNKCPHGNWYFLPWHRAYLLMYERAIREATGFRDFALPYWDWTRNPQLPPAFTQTGANSLLETRDMSPTDALPPENVGQAVLDSILGDAPFERFGTSRPNGQNSLDPSWIKRNGLQGPLERNPHNNVHGLVGGLMGGARSARDPIFMMHHCNIDRIWAVWRAAGNANSAEALWLDMPFQDHFVNPDGSTYSPKVRELLEPEPLGYTYGLLQAAPPAPVISAFGEKLTAAIAAPAGAAVAGVRTFATVNTNTARANDPLAVPVVVESSLVAETARRGPTLGTGAELLNFDLVRRNAASKTRAFAFIRDIELSNESKTQFRVFVDCDYLSQDTPIEDRHYVGTFGFFGEHVGHGDAKPSISVDLTTALEKLYGSTIEAPGQIRVQVLPVPRGRATAPEIGTATPARVEVAFISPARA